MLTELFFFILFLFFPLFQDQTILPGVGNVIKIEGLFDSGMHPHCITSHINDAWLKMLIIKLKDYARYWYYCCAGPGPNKINKKNVYGRQNCGICNCVISLIRDGVLKRITYLCPKCQLFPDAYERNEKNKKQKLTPQELFFTPGQGQFRPGKENIIQGERIDNNNNNGNNNNINNGNNNTNNNDEYNNNNNNNDLGMKTVTVPNTQKWTCAYCTLDNPFNLQICEICDTIRPVTKESSSCKERSVEEAKIVCQNNSLINLPNCDNDSGNILKYIAFDNTNITTNININNSRSNYFLNEDCDTNNHLNILCNSNYNTNNNNNNNGNNSNGNHSKNNSENYHNMISENQNCCNDFNNEYNQNTENKFEPIFFEKNGDSGSGSSSSSSTVGGAGSSRRDSSSSGSGGDSSSNDSNNGNGSGHSLIIPLLCNCTKQSTLHRVRKNGSTNGRLFWSCSGRKCDFFSWADGTFPKCQHGLPTTVRRVLKPGVTNGFYFFCCTQLTKCNFFLWTSKHILPAPTPTPTPPLSLPLNPHPYPPPPSTPIITNGILSKSVKRKIEIADNKLTEIKKFKFVSIPL